MINNIFEAISYLDIEYIQQYILDGKDVNYINLLYDAPLSYVCQKNTINSKTYTVASLLIDSGANINFQDKIGNSPLHYCIAYNQFEIFKKLIVAGADINVQNIIGNSPLHFATVYNQPHFLKILIENQVNPFLVNKENLNSLHLAKKFRKIECLDILQTYYDYHELLNNLTISEKVNPKIKL